jgi:hypothetical protein
MIPRPYSPETRVVPVVSPSKIEIAITVVILVSVIAILYMFFDNAAYFGCLNAIPNMTCVHPWWYP